MARVASSIPLLGLGSRRNCVCVGSAAPESGVFRFQLNSEAVVGERLVVPARVHVGYPSGLVQSGDFGLDEIASS